jgi:hypothetical protein
MALLKIFNVTALLILMIMAQPLMQIKEHYITGNKAGFYKSKRPGLAINFQ